MSIDSVSGLVRIPIADPAGRKEGLLSLNLPRECFAGSCAPSFYGTDTVETAPRGEEAPVVPAPPAPAPSPASPAASTPGAESPGQAIAPDHPAPEPAADTPPVAEPPAGTTEGEAPQAEALPQGRDLGYLLSDGRSGIGVVGRRVDRAPFSYCRTVE